MKKILLYISCTLFTLINTSCSEDFLEETNPNTISAELYWSNLEESNANLTSVYGALLNNYLISVDFESWRSDIAYPKDRDNPYQNALPWYRKTYNNSVKDYEKSWDAMYQVIWRANQVIAGLNSMGQEFKEQDGWKEQMGQARFFRGLMHFYLNSNYNNGKVIIRDKIPVTITDFSKSVSSSQEVIEFYRKDLIYAYNNLPPTFEDKSRVTAGTAATILGKSYLYTEEYPLAKTYLLDVITNNDYKYKLLEGDDVSLLFTSAGDFNDESIFEINYSQDHQQQDGTFDEESFFNRFARYAAPTVAKGGSFMVPTAWLTYEYSAEELDSNDSRNYVSDGSGGVKLRNVSLRAAQMVAVVNDEQSEYYGTTANVLTSFAGTTFSYFKKLTNHDIVTSENNILETAWKSGKNLVLYRLADVYLMYAECQIKTGNITDALTYINKIRRRWGLVLLGPSDGSSYDFDEVVYTEESLMEHLMYKERPLELCNEGYAQRSIDLRRWGVLGQRFNSLANQEYYLDNYVTQAGTNRNKSLLQIGTSPDPTDATITINEFDEAAANYNSNLHDYLPLPISETLYNQGSLK
ncbi:hypothetical protein FHR24_000712 [Wenyingzhuangia heitensis]|uniref:Starch-binding associating with outer membrane n=1 Tax=Wenyingzhuangia heitensis TaxID=1487859 RepID=A0ABX0U692_9FLAO|nr:RagB/SusD family nutrient uptake outer membrane protein [Wenyingzhuangia heitensis]NIJ44273.1 hypothetical protein [Wenyingzhuangia heitensis]